MQIHQQSNQQKNSDVSVVQPFERKEVKPSVKKFYIALTGVFVVLIALGIGTGYALSRIGTQGVSGKAVSTDGGKTFGSKDDKTFTDTAIGMVEKEGISGEGTHKLTREGGPSQTACLVSSVLDLDEFVGKKVKVHSKTMGAKKCPWLMDVGSIELQ